MQGKFLRDISLWWDKKKGKKREKIIRAAIDMVKEKYTCLLFGSYFGALEYGSENYFVFFVFPQNKDLQIAKQEGLCEAIEAYWRNCMLQLGYEEKNIKSNCEFAAQEECNKLYGGNWYYYYK